MSTINRQIDIGLSRDEDFSVRILSIGEILWDVYEGTEFLGGAPLNFSVSAQRLGNSTVLLSAVGKDTRGVLALDSMRSHDLTTDFVQISVGTATGAALVTIDDSGNASFVIQRPAAFDAVAVDDDLISQITQFQPQWIYFGTLAQAIDEGEQRLIRLLKTQPDAKRFYDINLRNGHWGLPLVKRISRLATIIKMNEVEAEELWHLTHDAEQPFSLEAFCQFWASTHGCELICVTLGGEGCAVWQNNALAFFQGFQVQVVDTVGAGDAFAAGFLHGLEQGWPIAKTALFANRLGALVASRSGATPEWTVDECNDTDIVSTR
jgi:fructokinase